EDRTAVAATYWQHLWDEYAGLPLHCALDLVLAAHLCVQLLDVDIDLACRADVANLEAVGAEAVFDEAGLLDRAPVLALVVDLEAGRRRPDVTRMAEREVAPLMHITAGDQPQIDTREHLDQPRTRRLRHVADRGLGCLGIVGQMEKHRLVQE